jgi:pyruvate kinase
VRGRTPPGHLGTQVFDQLAKSGQPSRAEITGAATGVRAEAVILNNGPHILDAVSTLGDILSCMNAHHYKKNALMRPLRSRGVCPATTVRADPVGAF